MSALTPVNSMLCITDLMFSPIMKKFPNVQIAISEGGNGWVPYVLERADYTYEHHKAWTHTDLGSRRPSDVFREQMWTCFIDDPVGIDLRDRIGIDRIMWECDYPHSDATWPNSPELLWKSLSHLKDDEINKITHLNAMACYDFDPFKIRPKEKATVGALRAEVADHDIAIKSMGRRKADADGASAAQRLGSVASGNMKK